MPKATPSIKVRNVSRLGAKVVLFGQDFDEAKTECARLAQTHGLVFVPPYDDPLVIAGQGTVGLEVLKQVPNPEQLDGIVAGVGGGGLISGIAEYVKRIGSPRTKVIGAETIDGDAMARSIEKGERVTLSEVGLFSDGTAVKIVGEEPFRICKNLLDGVVKVDTDELCAAIKDVFEGTWAKSWCGACRELTTISRDEVDHRACWCPCARSVEALHLRQPAGRGGEEVCGCHQRREHELRQAAVRRRACRVGRGERGASQRRDSREARKVRPHHAHDPVFTVF